MNPELTYQQKVLLAADNLYANTDRGVEFWRRDEDLFLEVYLR